MEITVNAHSNAFKYPSGKPHRRPTPSFWIHAKRPDGKLKPSFRVKKHSKDTETRKKFEFYPKLEKQHSKSSTIEILNTYKNQKSFHVL